MQDYLLEELADWAWTTFCAGVAWVAFVRTQAERERSERDGKPPRRRKPEMPSPDDLYRP